MPETLYSKRNGKPFRCYSPSPSWMHDEYIEQLPTKHDVELAIYQLGITDPKEQQEIRDYWDAQRPPGMFETLMELLWFLLRIGLLGAAIVFSIYVLVIAAAIWMKVW